MIEVMPESEGNVVVLRANGKLTDADYKDVLIPRLEEVIRAQGKARLLLDMGDEFHGWEPKAAWDDARFGIAHRDDFTKMGVIGGAKWVDWALKLGGLVVHGEIRSFAPAERDEALKWIKE